MSSDSRSSSVGPTGETVRVRAISSRLPKSPVQGLRAKIRIGGYSIAIISVLFALLLRLAVDPWLGDQSPYLLFVIAVAITGLYAGVRPALVAGALGTVVAYFCFVPPRSEWGFAGVSDAVGFGVYVFVVFGVILLVHARIRAAQKGEEHRMQAEETLLRTERLSASWQMASMLAHEINNPLAALTNVMFLLNEQPLDSRSQELLAAGTDNLNRVIRISRMTMGFFFEKDVQLPVRLRDIVDEVAATLNSAECFKNIQCTREFRADLKIIASPLKMKQLIASLLTNAMESGADKVCIRVELGTERRSPGRTGARITVGDNGRGIPPELRERVFEPFFTSKSEKGTGLGLWATRAIVLRNNGSISLRSAVSGAKKGTSVSVFLPVNVSETLTVPLNLRRAGRAAK
ncbi:MAG TPA: ATP-binding protein [Terriglobales bacterium]|nr:ATP-binding protein [Terriglobales bacterium]